MKIVGCVHVALIVKSVTIVIVVQFVIAVSTAFIARIVHDV